MIRTTTATAASTTQKAGGAPWLWQTVCGEEHRSPLVPMPLAFGKESSIGMTSQRAEIKQGVEVANPDVSAAHSGNLLRRALLLNPPGASLPGLSLAVTYAPAFAEQGPVGGDFFDAFALPGNTNEVALLVGDMTGKGIEAAVHIAAVKFALRAFLRDPIKEGLPCPGKAFARLNDFVCHAQALDGWEPTALVSAALVILNTGTGKARFALAAAEAPFVLPSKRGDDAAPTPYGLPLGAFANQQYEAASFFLPVGATLTLLTDGLTEARSPVRTSSGGIALLGCEGVVRLAGHALDTANEALPEMGRALLEQVRAYAGGRLSDDACLLLVRRKGNGESDV